MQFNDTELTPNRMSSRCYVLRQPGTMKLNYESRLRIFSDIVMKKRHQVFIYWVKLELEQESTLELVRIKMGIYLKRYNTNMHFNTTYIYL